MTSTTGPLGHIPGLLWDAERQRYFSTRGTAGPAASTTTSGAVPAVAEAASSVAARPVPRALQETLAQGFRPKKRRCGDKVEMKPSEQQTCAVCLELIQEKQDIFRLPCQHLFHEECLKPWMEKYGSCPSCRSAIDAALDTAQKAAEERWQETWFIGWQICHGKPWSEGMIAGISWRWCMLTSIKMICSWRRLRSPAFCVCLKSGRALSIHMKKKLQAEACDFSAGMLFGLPTHAGWDGWNVTPEAALNKKLHWEFVILTKNITTSQEVNLYMENGGRVCKESPEEWFKLQLFVHDFSSGNSRKHVDMFASIMVNDEFRAPEHGKVADPKDSKDS